MSKKCGGIAGRKRRTAIGSQFLPYTVEMIQSPAWQALPLKSRKILNRIEIEHAAHGGAENGKLKCTYLDFEKYGVRRKSISDALNVVIALGFAQITKVGSRAYGDIPGHASEYRLTHIFTADAPATHDWKLITSAEMAADAIAKVKRDYDNYLDTAPGSARRRQPKWTKKTEAQGPRRRSRLPLMRSIKPRPTRHRQRRPKPRSANRPTSLSES